MKAGETLAILLTAGLGIASPGLLKAHGNHPHGPTPGGEVEPVTEQAALVPLADFGPGLRLQLRSSVGGDHTSGVRPGRHDPADQPTGDRGLADAVAGADRGADRINCVAAIECALNDLTTDVIQQLARPCIRPVLTRVGVRPRLRQLDDAQRGVAVPVESEQYEGQRAIIEVRRHCRQHSLRVDRRCRPGCAGGCHKVDSQPATGDAANGGVVLRQLQQLFSAMAGRQRALPGAVDLLAQVAGAGLGGLRLRQAALECWRHTKSSVELFVSSRGAIRRGALPSMAARRCSCSVSTTAFP